MASRRGNLRYGVGNEHSPTDPFGRTVLLIAPDGEARLDHFTRAGHAAWTGTVPAEVLARLWAAVDEDGFFDLPRRPAPAGSATRSLTVGDAAPDARSMFVPYHAIGDRPAHAIAFPLLDAIIRQLGEDTIQAVPATDEVLVRDVRRVAAGG